MVRGVATLRARRHPSTARSVSYGGSLREGRPIRGGQAIAERPDGTRVPFMPYPTPLTDSEGNVIGGINMLVDLSAIEEAKEEERALINELNHRVKNTLSTVQSIARQTLRSTAEPASFVTNFQSRVVALAKAHDLLTRRRWTGVSLGELIDQEVVASLGPDAARLILEGPEITLGPRVGLALGMVLNELLMNARQFGAFSDAAGAVRFKWALVEIPFVFTTGYGVDGVREDLRHAPVAAKPFSPSELQQKLYDAMRPRATSI